MVTREEAKMFFDSDVEVLEKAFESDKEYADITQKTISVSVSKIYEILVQKGILTMEEALEHIKEVGKIFEETIKKEVENEKL